MSKVSAEFMRRFPLLVADSFPFNEGEAFEDYCTRARHEPVNVRLKIAVLMGRVVDDLKVERSQKKGAWIAAARLKFDPGPRECCAICGKYKSLTEAHHIVPLSLQFEAGAIDPIQEFRWLCPTHHAAEHVLIKALLATAPTPAFEGMPIEEKDALLWGKSASRFAELFYQLPRAHLLSPVFLAAWDYMWGNDK